MKDRLRRVHDPIAARASGDGFVRAVLPSALVALVLRVLVAWSLPLDASDTVRECAPDERGHLAVIQPLASGTVPEWPRDTAVIYAAFPPVPYLAHAAVLAGGRLLPGTERWWRFPPRTPEGAGHLWARAGSVLLGVATVVLLAAAALQWTSRLAAARDTALVAALYPQLVFVGGYSNADAYTIAAGALVVLALARWARRGEGDGGLGLLALALGLVGLGKPSGYFLLVTTTAWVVAMAFAGRVGARALARATAILVAVAAPCLAWNAWRNDGDVLGLAHYAAWLASLRHPFTPGIEIPNAPRLFVEWLSYSSFGVFRNLDLYLPTPFYVAALAFLLVGLGRAAGRWRGAPATDRRGVVWLAASVALNLALVVYNCWFVGFSPQGRYVLLMVVLLTAIALSVPGRRAQPGFWRAWPYGYGALLALAALWTVATIHANPCVGA